MRKPCSSEIGVDGYLLLASQAPKYFDMAVAAAQSIRFFDSERQICLICDSADLIDPKDRALFDYIVPLQRVDELRGTEHHIFLDRYSPFERSLYVDTDCLLSSRRIHDMWRKLEPLKVTFPGRKLTEGLWRKGVDIAELRAKVGTDYIVQCSGAVFYFDQSTESRNFFGVAQDLFERRFEISVRHNQGKGMANEPIWGAAMALTNRPIFSLGEHLNVSTLRTERWQVGADPSITLWKDGGTWSPVFCHFLGLGGPRCPNDLYGVFRQALRTPGFTAENTFTPDR